jgi:hypothetical protein
MYKSTMLNAAVKAVIEGKEYFWHDGNQVMLDRILVEEDGTKHILSIDQNGICPMYDFLCFDVQMVKSGVVLDMLDESECELAAADELYYECFSDTDFPY